MNPDIPLRDIHAAAVASWWPLAPLVWVLLGVVLIAVVVAGVIGFRRWRRALRKRALLLHLDALRTDFVQHRDRAQLAQNLSQWLRRLLLHKGGQPATEIAALTGERWSAHLAAPFAEDPRLLSAATQIASQPWHAQPTLEEDAVFDLAEAWVDHLSSAGYV